MKLNGITIINCEMFANEWRKEDFDGKEIWKNIKNGTLEVFEQDVVSQNCGPTSNKKTHQLAMEIVRCVRNLSEEKNAAEFLLDGKLNKEVLNENLKAFSANSFGTDQLDFFTRNVSALKRLYESCEEEWTAIQVNILYLFLLLQLQVLPKKAIREKDVDFLIALLQEQKPVKVEHRNAYRLCLTEDMILRCKGQEIQSYDLKNRSGWKCLHRSGEEVAGIAYTEELGLIAFKKSGKMCSKTSVKIRSEVGEKRIVMASAYGRQYVLLTEEGSVISNLPIGEDPAWKDVSWISVGLNSAAGISGEMNNAIEYGLNWNVDHTDVKAVVTRSGNGKKWYAVLKNDGTLEFDQGSSVEAVAAVCMGTRGYVYIKNGEVYVREYTGGPDRLAAKLPADATAEELHSVGNYFLCGTAEKPYLGMLR